MRMLLDSSRERDSPDASLENGTYRLARLCAAPFNSCETNFCL